MNAQLIADRYDLGERLGVGGMSVVVLAHDRRLERDVAVKLLAEHLAEDPQFVSRFRREALAAARLVHPNIVQVFDFGFDEVTGRNFIVMEYVRGQSAAQILRERFRLGVDEALPMLDGACRALGHAHRHGVVHRDVKPGNILRSDEGQVKLADFGIAKAADSSALTQAGSVLGTAAYLAPEQALGEDASPRSDLYGLGVVAYQLMAGRLPYDATSLTELALVQQREQPPRLDELHPEVPPALGDAVARALALDPADRYATAEEMRQALEAVARGVPVAWRADATQVLGREPTAATQAVRATRPVRRLEPQPPRSRPMPAPAGLEAEPSPARERPRRPARRRSPRRLLIGLLAVLILAGAIVAAVVATGDGGRERVQLREITGDDVGQVVDQLDRLIEDNVR
ncbi:MAG: protein kinase [Actinomycetota bacterium]|nr:protein kinase [Actinomycetota bacterium]